MSYSNKDEQAIDLKELFSVVWGDKKLITFISILAACISLTVSLSLQNIYTSNALLASSESEDSIGSKLDGFSGFAGFAGVSIPSSPSSKSDEAIARIQSYDFFIDKVLPNIKLENLMAEVSWDSEKNIITYDTKKFNIAQNKWIRNMKFPEPSKQEAYLEYKKILSISEDKKTKFVTLSIEHISPYVAKKWVELIVTYINSYMAELDRNLAEGSINYLKEVSVTTDLSQIKDTASILLEDQIQTLMLVQANDDYIFKYIQSPIAPEKKSRPGRALICILGTIFGGLFGILISLLNYYRKL